MELHFIMISLENDVYGITRIMELLMELAPIFCQSARYQAISKSFTSEEHVKD